VFAVGSSHADASRAESIRAKLPPVAVPVSSIDELELQVLRSSRSKIEGDYRDSRADAVAVGDAAGAVDAPKKKRKPMTEAAKAKRKLKRREKFLAKLRALGRHVGIPNPDRWKPRYLRRKGKVVIWSQVLLPLI
jgi:hypothetical protein